MMLMVKLVALEPRWCAADADLREVATSLVAELRAHEQQKGKRIRQRIAQDALKFERAVEVTVCNFVAISMLDPERWLMVRLGNYATSASPIYGGHFNQVVDLMAELGLITKQAGFRVDRKFRAPSRIKPTGRLESGLRYVVCPRNDKGSERPRRRTAMKTHYRVGIGLSMLVSAALGGVAVGELHAQAKSPVYFIGEIEVSNPDGYAKEYLPRAREIIKAHGGRLVAAGGAAGTGSQVIAIDGEAPKRVVIYMYPSIDAVHAWRNDPEYEQVRKIGEKYAKYRTFAVQGLPQQ
jgi:uncharacterized protein (DUF1330 family)